MTAGSETATVDEPPKRGRGRGYSSPRTEVAMWERVLSVALGGVLVLLGLRRRSVGGLLRILLGSLLLYRGISGRSRLYRALDVNTALDRARLESGTRSNATAVERSITVGGSAEDLHDVWRDPEQLSQIFGDSLDVTDAEGDRQRWELHAPAGQSFSWETRIVEDEPGEVLRWESVEGSTVRNEGSVRFRPAPAGQGTEVTLRVEIDPPGGVLATTAMERLDSIPRTFVGRALRRYKSLAETGEIPTLSHNPSGRGRGDLL